MPELVDWVYYEESTDNANKFVAWFIIEAMGQTYFKGKRAEEPITGPLEIEFKVNGVVVPFVETVKQMHQQFSRCVADEAVNQLNNRFAEIFESVGTLGTTLNELSDNMRAVLEQKGD